MANPLVGTDVQSCQAMLGGYASFLLADIQESIAKGRAVYHGDEMVSCLAGLEAQSCAQYKMPSGGLDIDEICEGVLEPKVAAGGACSDWWDCIDGFCEGDAGGLMDRCAARGVRRGARVHQRPLRGRPLCQASGRQRQHLQGRDDGTVASELAVTSSTDRKGTSSSRSV